MDIGKIRYRSLGFAVLALSLAGCDPANPKGALSAPVAQATAPALPVPEQKPAPASASVTPPPPTLEQQRVRLLIRQVEDAYALGEAERSITNLANVHESCCLPYHRRSAEGPVPPREAM